MRILGKIYERDMTINITRKHVIVALIFIFAILFRLLDLDHIPGINGDEAMYGINEYNRLHGGTSFMHPPSGKMLSPFHSGLVLILQSFLPVSFWVLRLPSAISGIVLLPLTFWIVRRLFDQKTALSATLLTAVLPINIGYSRLGWDPTQTTLIAIVLIFLALTRRWGWFILAQIAGYLIHPMNVFLAPLLLSFPYGNVLYRDLRTGKPWKALLLLLAGVLLAGVSGLAVLTIVRSQVAPVFFNNFLASIQHRVGSPFGWKLFLLDYVRLFNGTTIYRYISGAGYTAEFIVIDLCWAVALIGLFIFGSWRFWRKGKTAEMGLCVGLLVTLPLFYLLAGNAAIHAGQERYALFLIMPTILILACILRELAQSTGREWFIQTSIILLCVWFLAGFYINYFLYFMRTGGEAHYTYITGPEEPKQLCLETIVSDANGAKAVIVTSEWWNYCPIAYLARAHEKLTVVPFSTFEQLNFPKGQAAYVVAFSGDSVDQKIRSSYRDHVIKFWGIRDFAGRTVLYVYRFQ